jgi:hypothetical protein
MPGSSPARAFERNWYCRPQLVSAENIEKRKHSHLPDTGQTRLLHTAAASNCTTIFDCRRPRVATKGIQLQLRLVAHLCRETLIACDVETCAAQDFVVGDALSRFDVASCAAIWSERHLEATSHRILTPFVSVFLYSAT